MIYDTFETLKVGDKVRRSGKKRVYTVSKIVHREDKTRGVFLGPGDDEYLIESAKSLESVYHYINWDLVI